MAKINAKSVDLLIKSFASVIVAEIIGGVANVSALASWYPTLKKPSLIPPGYVFGIVWGILYLLMGASLYLVWHKDTTKHKWAVRAFYIQLALNVFWSIDFFALRSPLLGLIDILLMTTAIVWTIVLFYRHSKLAAYLLIPYLLWVLFATYLNWSVLILNR